MAESREQLTEYSIQIRQELKQWEKDFAAATEGRKAGRDDIKKNPIIAAKYRDYARIRDILSGEATAQTPTKPRQRRRDSHADAQTPRKTPGGVKVTPGKSQVVQQFDSPTTARKLLTPSFTRAFIGPTPQKDGRILGIFDFITSETPVKHQRTVLGALEPNVPATPSKVRTDLEIQSSLEEKERRSRTPASSGKRFMLDTFATPMKRKRDDEGTPSSTLKRFATPAFLRRNTLLDTVSEDEEGAGPPQKKRGLLRSLSSIIQGLRQQEDDRLDEELELMREMEDEGVGVGAAGIEKPEVLVEDSQAPMPLGPDKGVESDEDDGAGDPGSLDQNGQPREAWKKKGLKRQTRRVIMRPVKAKPQRQADLPAVSQDEREDLVPETQATAAQTTRPEDDHDNVVSDASFDGPDGNDSDVSDTPHARRKRKAQTVQTQAAKVAGQDPKKEGKENVVKKAARMISAQAHANYRKLKIKNKNSKANGRGRFGRR
ncbi:hypothetical protein LTR28_005902 [Elasticomyces elasticus]|nr:hypothetical protein LTR28_005902 [Elasticomyces elasticus]